MKAASTAKAPKGTKDSARQSSTPEAGVALDPPAYGIALVDWERVQEGLRSSGQPLDREARVHGNEAVLGPLVRHANPTALKISRPADDHEQEASRKADAALVRSASRQRQSPIDRPIPVRPSMGSTRRRRDPDCLIARRPAGCSRAG